MSTFPTSTEFPVDASDALLSMLQKAERCSDMHAEERLEIALLKFLALRARHRAAATAKQSDNQF